MGRDVTPNFKDGGSWNCPKDDETCTRAKPCRSCLGSRNRRSGKRAQTPVRKAFEAASGTQAAKFAGQLGNEESWSGLPVRIEVKSGAQVGPVWTRYVAAETQSLASKSSGDGRPFVFAAMPKGTTDGLVVFRLSMLERFIEAMTA